MGAGLGNREPSLPEAPLLTEFPITILQRRHIRLFFIGFQRQSQGALLTYSEVRLHLTPKADSARPG